IDALGFRLALAPYARLLGQDRRNRDVARAAILDLDHVCIGAAYDADTREAEIDDVPFVQPDGTMHTHAVVEHLCTVHRPHEELLFVDAQIRLGAFRASCQDDCAPLTTDRERELCCGNSTLAERFSNDQLVQIGSSQRMTIGSSFAPGNTSICRRTSR